ncbi:MAG TPA: sulfatase-like hydrolase/transferase, partial [Porticoccaceae bacterium]
MTWKKILGTTLCLGALVSPAHAQTGREVLPLPPPAFKGTIGETVTDSTPDPDLFEPVRPPQGAPNVFVMMSDDVGFAMSSAFGGPVATPNFEKLAQRGQRYNRFHTTAICSPSRAALLTGRNPHNTGSGYLTDAITGYPGYQGRISAETATIAQTLRLNGYNTAMFGKHHNVPYAHTTANGPFDQWPTGLGFEYFFGYLGPETDQFRPNLYRGTSLLPNDDSMQLLDARLADDAIRWIHNQQALGNGQPFFIYFAPSSTHAPHQAPPELIASFKGRFDDGWDKLRESIWRRQLELGIIPPGTQLTPRPDDIPAWDSLSAEEQAVAARAMEVAAAMLAYQDQQVGRVLDEIERMGLLNNTLTMLILGDNGASADSGIHGYFNRLTQTNRLGEGIDPELMAQLGGPNSYGNYPAGWAWAMNTPLRWTKQYASMLGGIRNGMIVAWPERMKP